jgi:hypothetical protein
MTRSNVALILNILAVLVAAYSLVWHLHGESFNGNGYYGIDLAIFFAVMASNIKGKG